MTSTPLVEDLSTLRPLSPEAPITPGSPALKKLIEAIGEGALERERDHRAPFELVELVRQSRLGALRVPLSRGGSGCSLRELFEVVIELGDADPNMAHILRNHFSQTETRLRSLREGEPNRWIEEVVGGALFGHATTELGSAAAGGGTFQTAVTPVGDHYVLNGVKYYCTGSMYADWVVVQAQFGPDQTASVMVAGDQPGVIHEDDWDGMGQRLTGSGTTRFVDVEVPADQILPNNKARRGPGQATFPQLYLTAITAGILRNALRDATAMVRGRGRTYYHAPAEKATEDPILQLTIGQIASNAFAAETLILAAADALDRSVASAVDGQPDPLLAAEAALRAAKAKVVIDELGQRTTSLLFDVGGASATKASYRFDRHWRNARTLASHNPATYKAQAVGNYELNGTPLPQGAYF